MESSAHLVTHEQAVDAREAAARALYNAEIALHDAYETQVDSWISAAADRLHDAVVTYEATLAYGLAA